MLCCNKKKEKGKKKMLLWEKYLLSIGAVLFISGIIAYWIKSRDLTEQNTMQLEAEKKTSTDPSKAPQQSYEEL